jgi:diaphanous 1
MSPGRYAKSYGPASATGLTRLVPQLTGDGLMKRLSIWGNSTIDANGATSGNFDGPIPNGDSKAQITEEPQPIQPQATGGLWSSWFASSGGKVVEGTPKWYVDGLQTYKTTDKKLLKHLISLRVHLGTTSQAVWVHDFMWTEKGLETMATLLANLVGKGGKTRSLTEIEESNVLEIIKCINILVRSAPPEVSFCRIPNIWTLD